MDTRYLLRFFDYFAHPNLSATFATDFFRGAFLKGPKGAFFGVGGNTGEPTA